MGLLRRTRQQTCPTVCPTLSTILAMTPPTLPMAFSTLLTHCHTPYPTIFPFPGKFPLMILSPKPINHRNVFIELCRGFQIAMFKQTFASLT